MPRPLGDLIGCTLRRAVGGAAPLALAVAVATCQLGELVSPGPPATLAVNADGVRDSAPVGSRFVRVQEIALANTGPGSIGWTAARVGGSLWLGLSVTSGSTPDTLSLLLDPAGLFVGEYHDTVRIVPTDGSADTTEVAVMFAVQPCRKQALTLGETVTDSLGPADCEAPRRADRFAKLYHFTTAVAGDSVTVVLQSTAFDPYVLVDSTPAGSLPPLAEADRCGTAAGACVRYVLLPRAGDFYVEVTSAGTGSPTGPFALEVHTPRPPTPPTAVAQLAVDSVTPLAPGATIAVPAFVARATAEDPDVGDSLALEVEARPFGTPFTGLPTAVGALSAVGAVMARVDGLGDNAELRWQARTRDITGRVSPWVAFGSGAAADVRVVLPEGPAPPTALGQRRSDGTTVIAIGGTTNEATVLVLGTVSDPDPGDLVRVEVEVRPLGTPFTNTPNGSSVAVPSGGTGVAPVAGLADNTDYHWQARAVDETGRSGSWVSFGGNAESAADFRVQFPPAQLVFATQPSAEVAGASITPAPVVELRKGTGGIDTSFSGAVTLAITPGTGAVGAVLGGTTTRDAVDGTVSFPGLSIDRPGSGYRLSASAPGLPSVVSTAFDVTGGPTTTTVTAATPSPSVTGQPVTLSFTVTSAAGTPTGNVTVGEGVTSCTASVAVGKCTVAFPTSGARSLTAAYGGDGSFAASSSEPFAHTVSRASTATTITGSPSSATVVGESYTVSVAVTVEAPGAGTPTGTVTVSDGTETCQADVAEGSCVLTATTAGTKNLTASYAGDADFTGSATLAGRSHTVKAAVTTTTITGASPDPSAIYEPVTVLYAVAVQAPGAGTPTGTVTVSDGAGTTCTGTVAEASCAMAFVSAGAKTLTATYAGDANFTGSKSPGLSHTVVRAATITEVSSSANPAVAGQTITFTARVTSAGSTPRGRVRFYVGGTLVGDSKGVRLSDGVAGVSTRLSAGTYVVIASYLGDANYEPSADTLTPDQVVNGSGDDGAEGQASVTGTAGTTAGTQLPVVPSGWPEGSPTTLTTSEGPGAAQAGQTATAGPAGRQPARPAARSRPGS